MKPPEFPYVILTRRPEGIGGFRWGWRIILDETDATRDWGSHVCTGIAMTKLGARWSARHAWKRYLKEQDYQAEPPEYFPL